MHLPNVHDSKETIKDTATTSMIMKKYMYVYHRLDSAEMYKTYNY